ncbi:class I SAM-dependent methyltransferase [Oleispirillum naphthae]|uniref:class I SAM-dependent methyltransferase n=1 Tax=Oleispirillum naphthae TaxID=2838853 RepID=UPI00308258B6
MSNMINMQSIVDAVLSEWPEHEIYISKSLSGYTEEERAHVERLSERICALAGDRLPDFAASYKWLCGVFNEEQIAFIRTGKYRRTSFAEANAEVYANKDFMQKYMEGLLVSQLLWSNHARAFLFHDAFIDSLKEGTRYLEVGPGHGLYLATAALNPRCAVVEAWDVSAESLEQTAASTRRMGISRPVRLAQRDVAEVGRRAEDGEPFDVVVISEVLEHLEDPLRVLKNLRTFLVPGGRIFVHFPINSPAPDHIYLLTSLDEVRAMVEEAGFRVETAEEYPTTGYTLKRAMATKATVSCLVIGVNP